MNTRVFSILNEKGGVGKSTLAMNLAVELSKRGYRVLLMDNDPQGNSTGRFLAEDENVRINRLAEFKEKLKEAHAKCNSETEHVYTSLSCLTDYLSLPKNEDIIKDMNDVILNPIEIRNAIQKTSFENLSIVPATHKLSTTDTSLKMNQRNATGRIRAAIDFVEGEFDVVLIDNGPIDNALTYNSFCACKNEGDMILIPTKLDDESWAGMEHTVKSLLEWLDDPYVDLKYDFRVVANMTNDTRYSKEAYSVLQELWNSVWNKRFLDTQIHYQNAPIQGNSYEKTILLDETKKKITNSRVYSDYMNLINEIEDRLIKGGE